MLKHNLATEYICLSPMEGPECDREVHMIKCGEIEVLKHAERSSEARETYGTNKCQKDNKWQCSNVKGKVGITGNPIAEISETDHVLLERSGLRPNRSCGLSAVPEGG